MSDDLGDLNLPDIMGDFEELVFKNVDIEADELSLLIPEEGDAGGAMGKVVASRVLQAIAPFLR